MPKDHPKTTDRPLTTAALAAYFNVSQRTVQRWLAEGKLQDDEKLYRTIGGHWRIGKPPTLDDLPEIENTTARAALAEAVTLLALLLEQNLPPEEE